MPINKNGITKEILEKALRCKDADELIALAKTGGFDITRAEAEAYMEEMADMELDGKALKNIAGGSCYMQDSGNGCERYWPDRDGY